MAVGDMGGSPQRAEIGCEMDMMLMMDDHTSVLSQSASKWSVDR